MSQADETEEWCGSDMYTMSIIIAKNAMQLSNMTKQLRSIRIVRCKPSHKNMYILMIIKNKSKTNVTKNKVWDKLIDFFVQQSDFKTSYH